MWNVTYKLSVVGKGVMRLSFKKCSVTHKLWVIGKGVMRLPFTKMCTFTHNLLSQDKM